MADFDAIIVGAGHNGLICASYLSRAGWRVAVLEGSAQVGGGLRSDVKTLPGFVHDNYATNLGLFTSSPVYRELKPELDALGLGFRTTAQPYASILRDTAIRVSTDINQTVDAISSVSPGDARGWVNLVDFYKRISPSILPFFYTEMLSGLALRKASHAVFGNRPNDTVRLAKLLCQSSSAFARDYFVSPDVAAVLQAWGYHFDFPPEKRGGALFAFIAAMSGHVHGMRIAEGGAGNVSKALRKLIEGAGGIVLTQSEVSQIIVRRSRAMGVRTYDGRDLTATRAVVANVTTRNLFGKLIGPTSLPQTFFSRTQAFRYGPGTFIIHVALARMPVWKAGADLGQFGYVHLNVAEAEIARTYADCMEGRLPARPLLVVSQPTHIDPSRAPDGQHVMRIHVRTVPGEITGDAAGKIGARDWVSAKDPFAERVLDLVEEQAPDLRQCIIAMSVETPWDLERENPNFIGGDCVSGSHHIGQNFFLRPFFGWSNYRTPIDGLFMIGASTWPGGGIHGASGYLVARKLAYQ